MHALGLVMLIAHTVNVYFYFVLITKSVGQVFDSHNHWLMADSKNVDLKKAFAPEDKI